MEGKVKTKEVPPNHGKGNQYMPELVAGEEVVKGVYEQYSMFEARRNQNKKPVGDDSHLNIRSGNLET